MTNNVIRPKSLPVSPPRVQPGQSKVGAQGQPPKPPATLRSPSGNVPTDVKGAIEYSQELRERLQKFEDSECDKCGSQHYITHIARRAGIDKAGLWRFYKIPGATMVRETLQRLDVELRKMGF